MVEVGEQATHPTHPLCTRLCSCNHGTKACTVRVSPLLENHSRVSRGVKLGIDRKYGIFVLTINYVYEPITFFSLTLSLQTSPRLYHNLIRGLLLLLLYLFRSN